MSLPAAVYRPRNPQLFDYYRCVEDYFETFVRIYDEYFSRQYGFWRPYLEKVIYRYLDCGDPHNGFARVKCKDCGHEYLLAFSASAVISAHPAIRSAWWSSGNGYCTFKPLTLKMTDRQSSRFVGKVSNTSELAPLKNLNTAFLLKPSCNKACGILGEQALFQSKRLYFRSCR